MTAKVYLVESQIFPTIVSHGILEDGTRVFLPFKLTKIFLPEQDEKGLFVTLNKDYLIKTKKFIRLNLRITK